MGTMNFEDWVPAADRSRFNHPELALQTLEVDPQDTAAVSTLFWWLLRGYWLEGTGDESGRWINSGVGTEVNYADIQRYSYWLNRMYDLTKDLLETREPPDTEGELERALVQLYLSTFLLYVIRDGKWGSPELIDELIKIGKSSFNIIPDDEYEGVLNSTWYWRRRFEELGLNLHEYLGSYTYSQLSEHSAVSRQRKQSLSAVLGIFFNEYFHHLMRNMSYEDALTQFANAAALWNASESSLCEFLNLQEAAECFKKMYIMKSNVSSWQNITKACNLICDSLQGAESNDLDPYIEVTDIDGYVVKAEHFWHRAARYSECELSPSDFIRAKELEKESRHRERLKIDFFGELWPYLEEDTIKHLIASEIAWYDAPKVGAKSEAAADELKLAFEYELDRIIFEHRRAFTNSVLNDKQLSKSLGLSKSGRGGKLSARNMAILLEAAGYKNSVKTLQLKIFIDNLPITENDKTFLHNELPSYLKKLVDARNWPEHRDKKKDLLNEIKSLRRIALGIGQPGYLYRLLDIKRMVLDKKRQ